MMNAVWKSPPATVYLPENDVHIWLASLREESERISNIQSLLSSDELARAGRFVFDEDRTCYIASHGILRTLIGKYLNVPPACVSFYHNDYGKPYVQNNHTLNFNISYSRDLALFAFTGLNRQIGIDLEYIHQDIDCKSIAQSMFSASDYKFINGLNEDDLTKAFFTIWVRKEAYVKAHGEGLSLKLDEFEVSQHIGDKNRAVPPIISVIDNNSSTWTIKDVPIVRNYVGAIAVEGQMLEAKYWHFSMK